MRPIASVAVASISIALFTLMGAAPVSAQDATGAWEIAYTMQTPRGSMERTMVVHLEQDGASLTGTAEMPAMRRPGGGGGGSAETRTVDISDGMVAGNEVLFTITLGRGDRTFAMTFSAAMDGDTMEGSVTNPMGGGESPFTGARQEG
jgi:hypothetical protein